MNNFNEQYKMNIAQLIRRDKKINDISISCLCQKELFDFFKEIPKIRYVPKDELTVFSSIKPYDEKPLCLERFRNLLKYVNILFFNRIKEKLQINKENSKTTKIKLNNLDETPSKLWKSKVEDYIEEVEILLRKILKSDVDDERNFTVTMILSNDFSNLWKNKLNNSFYCFAKFDNLVDKYNIQYVSHPFLNKSNELVIPIPDKTEGSQNEKINSNLKNYIIFLVITKKEDDFRLQINEAMESLSYEEELSRNKLTITKIIFDKKWTNLSKAEIFAIKS